jgi:hypothetical protein
MLIVSGVFVSVNAVALLVAGSYGSLYFIHNRLQTTADELALLGTSKLNEQDRIGQMNNMIARSRQLVNDAESSYEEAQTNLNQLSQITDQLHNEARAGAMLLETERNRLAAVCTTEAGNIVASRFAALKQGHALTLPWLQVSEPSLDISYGRIEAVQSNVKELTGIDTLSASDKTKYVSADGSKLYKNNVNARLEGSDADLSFKLCSLPAPVDNSISPARAVLARKYLVASDDNISSAVKVNLKLNISTGIGASASSTLSVNGTAVTVGGQPVM